MPLILHQKAHYILVFKFSSLYPNLYNVPPSVSSIVFCRFVARVNEFKTGAKNMEEKAAQVTATHLICVFYVESYFAGNSLSLFRVAYIYAYRNY